MSAQDKLIPPSFKKNAAELPLSSLSSLKIESVVRGKQCPFNHQELVDV